MDVHVSGVVHPVPDIVGAGSGCSTHDDALAFSLGHSGDASGTHGASKSNRRMAGSGEEPPPSRGAAVITLAAAPRPPRFPHAHAGTHLLPSVSQPRPQPYSEAQLAAFEDIAASTRRSERCAIAFCVACVCSALLLVALSIIFAKAGSG